MKLYDPEIYTMIYELETETEIPEFPGRDNRKALRAGRSGKINTKKYGSVCPAHDHVIAVKKMNKVKRYARLVKADLLAAALRKERS